MGNSEWMLIHFILIFVFIFGTGTFLLQWLYMKDQVEQAILRERERVTKEIFENYEVFCRDKRENLFLLDEPLRDDDNPALGLH